MFQLFEIASCIDFCANLDTNHGLFYKIVAYEVKERRRVPDVNAASWNH